MKDLQQLEIWFVTGSQHLLAAGIFSTLDEAQTAMCLPFETYIPQAESVAIYEELYGFFRSTYFTFGSQGASAASLGMILPELRRLSGG